MKFIKLFISICLVFSLLVISGCKNKETPKVYSVDVTSGLVDGGNKVSIYGELLPSDIQVYFGDNKATVESNNDSTVVVTVPKGKPGDVIITVKTGDQIISNAFKYIYIEKEIKSPIITGISVTKSLTTGGEHIAIYGQNFSSDAKVYFGNTEATVETIDAILITAIIPTGSVGVVDVKVKNIKDNKEATLKNAFEYYEEEILAPEIVGLSINQGTVKGGDQITIYGKNNINNDAIIAIKAKSLPPFFTSIFIFLF